MAKIVGEEAKKLLEEVKGSKSELSNEVELSDEELDELLRLEQSSNTRPIQKKLIIEWQANDRPYKPLNREMFSTVVAGTVLLGIILFVIEGPVSGTFVVMFLASVIFLWYVMGTVPPQMTVYRMLTWGIEVGNKLYPFEMMTRFWVEGQDKNRMLVVELVVGFPRHLRVMIDSEETEEVLREVLEEIIIEDQPKPNWLDKVSTWFEKQIRWSLKS